jgi:hypothetical protein
MASYLFLFGDGASHETEEAQAEAMQVWGDWFTKLGGAVKDAGNPLSGTAKTVAANGSVSDGLTSPSGYTVVTADSLDAAVALTEGCPVLAEGASIGVFEIVEVM